MWVFYFLMAFFCSFIFVHNIVNADVNIIFLVTIFLLVNYLVFCGYVEKQKTKRLFKKFMHGGETRLDKIKNLEEELVYLSKVLEGIKKGHKARHSKDERSFCSRWKKPISGLGLSRSDALHVLELKDDFSGKDLTAAWRRKAFETHPDRGGDEEEFKKISDAYRFLNLTI